MELELGLELGILLLAEAVKDEVKDEEDGGDTALSFLEEVVDEGVGEVEEGEGEKPLLAVLGFESVMMAEIFESTDWVVIFKRRGRLENSAV